MQLPLLSLLLATPLAGALLIALAPERAARGLHAATLAATLAIALAVVAGFDPANPAFQFVERHRWIPTLNIHYALGVDGIALLFLPLTLLPFSGVLVDAWNARRPPLFHGLLLVQLAATLGVFCATDTMLFFLFWELSLLPLYFLVALWGDGPQRRHAAAQYVLIMLASGAFLLFGLLLAAAQAPDGWNFDLARLITEVPPLRPQWPIFLLLLAGFAAKTPLIPLHTWLPTTAMQGPAATIALLVGLKIGAYGIIRIAVPLAPDVARELHWLLAGLGTVGVLYGAVAALTQSNLRRMLAYASVSHVGLVLLGIASFDALGLQGALLLLQGFSLSAAGLFVLTACLHRRRGSVDVLALGGVVASAPKLTALFLLFGLASIGLPGLIAFPAELAIVVSALGIHTGAGLAALFGSVVGAAAFLALYRRAFLGPPRGPALPDLRPRELAWAGAVALLILAAGLWPGGLFELPAASVGHWLSSGGSR